MSTIENLTEQQQDILDDLVHDTASQTASNAINAGEQDEFLRALGHSEDDIAAAIADDVDEAVHDAAASEASDAINGGDGWAYLLANGWSEQDIRDRLGL